MPRELLRVVYGYADRTVRFVCAGGLFVTGVEFEPGASALDKPRLCEFPLDKFSPVTRSPAARRLLLQARRKRMAIVGTRVYAVLDRVCGGHFPTVFATDVANVVAPCATEGNGGGGDDGDGDKSDWDCVSCAVSDRMWADPADAEKSYPGWERLSHEAPNAAADDNEHIDCVVPLPGGRLLAVGMRESAVFDCATATWKATDCRSPGAFAAVTCDGGRRVLCLDRRSGVLCYTPATGAWEPLPIHLPNTYTRFLHAWHDPWQELLYLFDYAVPTAATLYTRPLPCNFTTASLADGPQPRAEVEGDASVVVGGGGGSGGVSQSRTNARSQSGAPVRQWQQRCRRRQQRRYRTRLSRREASPASAHEAAPQPNGWRTLATIAIFTTS